MEGTNWIKLMSIKAIIGTAEKGEKIVKWRTGKKMPL